MRSVTPVALAAANVRRWNLQSLGGRLVDVVRTALTTCLRPWTPKIQEALRRTKRTMFVDHDEIKFARTSRERVSTHLHTLRMLLNDAGSSRTRPNEALAIPDDIHLLARDVVFQCVAFVEMCDELISLSETLTNNSGNPSAIRNAVNGGSNKSGSNSNNFYTNAVNESVSKSRQSIFGNSASPTTFADTSRPRERQQIRASTPTISFSSSPPRSLSRNVHHRRIPDFHNNHIPVEIVLLNQQDKLQLRNNFQNNSPSRQQQSLLPRERDFSPHSPDGISFSARKRLQQQKDYEEYQVAKEKFLKNKLLMKNQHYDDEAYDYERTDDELPAATDLTPIARRNNNTSSELDNYHQSPPSLSNSASRNLEFSRRSMERNKSYIEDVLEEHRRRGEEIRRRDEKERKSKCRAPSPHSGEHLVDSNMLSPRMRSTIESAVNAMINTKGELSDEDRLWLVASLRRLKIDDELSNPY
jgi:hypothetical protein